MKEKNERIIAIPAWSYFYHAWASSGLLPDVTSGLVFGCTYPNWCISNFYIPSIEEAETRVRVECCLGTT